MDPQRLGKGLGWFSIGLGIAELVAPHLFTNGFGMRKKELLVRLYGMRELGAGVGLLETRRQEPWVKARIAGDALDIGTLVPYAKDSKNKQRQNATIALGSVLFITALDIVCLVGLMKRNQKSKQVLERAKRQAVEDQARRGTRATPPATLH